ncbi:MAG: hypothetical protein KBG48_06980 [Kofleriaceae bacterium]|jgi:hypothetical protein|nr:hypothetical protein [Kofleriaceae bacterium]MBP9167112.1 hypothetical protein [Kofleriaceae bacterium]MBP9860939.1 hypothetical protein [Kofleriaceae bacterium]
MTARRLLCAAALWLGLFAFAPAARAGVVAGKLELPTELGPAPLLGRAFVPRLANPLAPTPGLDPVPHLVVVLVPADGAVAPKPTTITWELRGESFARPLVAARLGDTLEIRNGGRGAPRFVAHGQPQLLPKKPLNPSDRLAVTPTQAGLLDLIDQATPHLRGRALILPAGYYAYPDANRRFEFPDVPAGDYTLRVFYAPRNLAAADATPTAAGWIDRPDDKLTVGAKRTDLTLKLPPALPVKP